MTKAKTTNLANPIVYDSLDLSSYIGVGVSGAVTNYYCWLSIKIGGIPFDTTNTENCTVNTTAVNEFDQEASFEIFPNPIPINGSAIVKSPITGPITITDMQGRQVASQKIVAGVDNTINHGDFAPGIYNICLFDESGMPVVSRKVLWE